LSIPPTNKSSYFSTEGATLKHKTIKAAATTTDQGVFSALAAAYTVDRVKDQIVPGAFEKTIKAWQENKRQIPLHWDHEGNPESIIGTVDPTSMRETKEGLYVEGKLDLENSEIAREAWRSMKNNALALSFGYLATKTRKKGQVTQLLEIDLFEISVVPAPANDSTRVLSLKSALAEEVKAEEETAKEEPAFKDIEAVQTFLDETFPGHKISKASESSKSEDPLRKRTYDAALEIAGGDPQARHVEPEPVPEPEPLDAVALRRQSERAALDIALG
jgi:HK97 family phage prohead protease